MAPLDWNRLVRLKNEIGRLTRDNFCTDLYKISCQKYGLKQEISGRSEGMDVSVTTPCVDASYCVSDLTLMGVL